MLIVLLFLKYSFIGLFQPVVWLKGYKAHRKPNTVNTSDNVGVFNKSSRLKATKINPKENPNQDLIIGLFGVLR